MTAEEFTEIADDRSDRLSDADLELAVRAAEGGYFATLADELTDTWFVSDWRPRAAEALSTLLGREVEIDELGGLGDPLQGPFWRAFLGRFAGRLRQRAKVMNFGLPSGMGAAKLASVQDAFKDRRRKK